MTTFFSRFFKKATALLSVLALLASFTLPNIPVSNAQAATFSIFQTRNTTNDATLAGFNFNNLTFSLFESTNPTVVIASNLDPFTNLPNGNYEIEYQYNGGTLAASNFKVSSVVNATAHTTNVDRIQVTVNGADVFTSIQFDINASDVFLSMSASPAATAAGFNFNNLQQRLLSGAVTIFQNINPMNNLPNGTFDIEFDYLGSDLVNNEFRINTTTLTGASSHPTDPDRIQITTNGQNININIQFDITFPTVSFQNATSAGSEATTPATANVVLNKIFGETITVVVNSSDVSTTAGTDYTAIAAQTITFLSGETSKAVDVVVSDDNVDEDNEDFRLTLSALVNTTLGATPTHTYTIQDNDTAGITLGAPSSTTTTEAGGVSTFTMVLDTVPTANVTINLSTSDASEGLVSPTTVTFTPANATTPQTITVTGQNDATADGDINYSIVTQPASSADAKYNGVDATNVALTNNDDDTPGITVVPTAGLTTTEAGGTATFTVVLDSVPTADVTIPLVSSNTNEGTPNPASLTFTAANALTPQTVTVTGVNDFAIDGDVTYTIETQAATSADGNYNGRDADNVDLTNTDNDTVGVTITPNGGLTTTEAGGTATFTINLDTDPTGDVTIALSSDNTNEGTVAPASVTFTTANARTPQTVTVTGVDDAVLDGNQAFTIVTAAATSTDGNYNGFDANDVSATNVDDEAGANIIVNPTNGLVTTEAGGTATFTVALSTIPTADVVIGITSNNLNEGTVTPATLTFTTANGIVPQTVTITGVDDAAQDGNIAYQIITAAATSADANYNGVNASDVDVTNNDNDSVGITVAPVAGLSTTEAGGTATFTVVLDTLPTADVTIGLSSSDASEGSVAPAVLTFTAANGTTPQTVTVTGTDDMIDDGDIVYTIITAAAVSTDANYDTRNASDVSVTNTDDDTAGITVNPTVGLTTTEAGGTATFTVVLDTFPVADVVINLSSDDATEGTVSPNALTFTAANGTTPQTVTITGVDDALLDGNITYNIVTAAAQSTDLVYNTMNAADVAVTNTDNDTAGITVNPTAGLTTTEAGGTATFTVVLDTVPTADVTIGLSSDNLAEGTVAPATLTFTAANGTTPQTVTVTGVNDALLDGNIAYNIVTAAATSADASYNAVNAADVAVTNNDDDTPGFVINPTAGLTTTEAGGTATFTVALNTLPTADVTLGLTSSNLAEGTVAPATLTFTAANGTTPQTVTVTGVDDAVIDGDIAYAIVTAASVSADANYNAIDPSDVMVTNTDNDTPGITVAPIAGLTTTEGGGTATFTVVLNTTPTADVSLGLTSSNLTEGTVAPATLTFTVANALTPQTVTVTGVDDAVQDGDVGYQIVTAAATSADANYNGVNAADVAVTNTDDDLPGVVVNPVAGLTTTEAGGTATFTVVLNTLPTADVTFAISSDNTNEGTVAPATLTFTAANGTTPQTVTVTGVDDAVVDGNVAYNIITGAAVSADGNYVGNNPADVAVTNTDNDAGNNAPSLAGTDDNNANAALGASPAALTVEVNTSISLTFNSVDADGDTVTLTETTDGAINGALSTFTVHTPAAVASNQTATFTYTPDAGEIGVRSFVFNANDGNGGSTNYTLNITVNALAANAPTVAFTQTNGGAPVSNPNSIVSGNALNFTVTGADPDAADNVTLTLQTNPTPAGNLAVFTAPGAAANPAAGTLTWIPTAANAQAAPYKFVFRAVSNGTTVDVTLNVFVTQNPVAPSIVVTAATPAATTEAGGTATFTVALSTLPAANVTIPLGTSDITEGTVAPAALSFTPANGTTPQTVTVTGVDDAAVDGNISYAINLGTSTSTDPNYVGLISAVALTNTDNDFIQNIVNNISRGGGGSGGRSAIDRPRISFSSFGGILSEEVEVAVGSTIAITVDAQSEGFNTVILKMKENPSENDEPSATFTIENNDTKRAIGTFMWTPSEESLGLNEFIFSTQIGPQTSQKVFKIRVTENSTTAALLSKNTPNTETGKTELEESCEFSDNSTTSVRVLCELGLIKPASNDKDYFSNDKAGKFFGSQTINRAEFTKMMVLLTQEESDIERVAQALIASNIFPFIDVEPLAWFARYIGLAKDMNAVNGYANGTYAPWNPIELSEAFKIVVEASTSNEKIRQDLENSRSDAGEGAAWFAAYDKVINNYSGFNTPDGIDPGISLSKHMTRQQAADIVYAVIRNAGIQAQNRLSQLQEYVRAQKLL